MKLKYFEAAEKWTEALPLGNGHIGAMVFGRTDRERIALNLDTLWSGYPRKVLDKNAKSYLPEIRKLIFADKLAEGEELLRRTSLFEMCETFQPLGDILIEYGREKTTGYENILDFDTGSVVTKYTAGGIMVCQTVFVSNPDNFLAVKIESAAPISFDVKLDTKHPHNERCILENNCISVYGNAPDRILDLNPFLESKADYSDGKAMAFSCNLSVIADGNTSAVDNNIQVSKTTKCVIICVGKSGFLGFDKMPNNDREDIFRKAQDSLEALLPFDIESAFSMHIKDYKSLFDASETRFCDTVEIDIEKSLKFAEKNTITAELATAYVNFAKHLYISASRFDSQAMNLQGIWNEDTVPAWGSNYTTNINTEMNYWLCDRLNLSVCFNPFNRLLIELQQTGAEAAREIYGCRGFCSNHNVDIWKKATTGGIYPVCVYYPLCGAWLATHLFEHYRITLDRGFLEENYCLIEQALLFCMDWLVEYEGKYVTCPATSPEHGFDRAAVSYASSIDVFIIRQLYNDYLSSSRILNKEPEFAKEFGEKISRLYTVGIDKKGRLLEWCEDYKYSEKGHRHISHLIGFFPFSQIPYYQTEDSGTSPYATKLYLDAVNKSIDYRCKNGCGHTGWSAGWVINVYARLHDREQTERFITKLFRDSTYPNLFDKHPPFQIDGNFGGAAGIIESILQYENGVLELLPALPRFIRNGVLKNICMPDGYKIDLEWKNGIATQLRIFSTVKDTIKIRNGAAVTVYDIPLNKWHKVD